MEYRVDFKGFVIVEADSPEEAEEKFACDDISYGQTLITNTQELDDIVDYMSIDI